MASASPAGRDGGSLREQLCQIEQSSVGVCHIAEVQLWPGPGMRTAFGGSPVRLQPRPRRAPLPRPLIGSIPILSPKPAAKPAAGATPLVWREPRDFLDFTGRRLVRPAGRGKDGAGSPAESCSDLDGDLGQSLRDAVAALVEDGSLFKDCVEDGVEGLPRVVALGEACEPAPGPICGRLPRQLADLRLELRRLASTTDGLQAIAAPARHGAASLESLQTEHSEAMRQATRLLGGC